MSIGEARHEIVYNKPLPETLSNLEKALAGMGTVKNVDRETFTIQGVCKYGLQTVQIKADLKEEGSQTRITLLALSDDIWAAGAKSAIQRLSAALQHGDDLSYQPDKMGVSPAKLFLSLGLFLAILLLVIYSRLIGLIPDWSMVGLLVLGFGGLVYFIIKKMRFGR